MNGDSFHDVVWNRDTQLFLLLSPPHLPVTPSFSHILILTKKSKESVDLQHVRTLTQAKNMLTPLFAAGL